METDISELKVMVGVLLALMLLVLVAVVALLLRFTSTKKLKVPLPVFFRSKDEGRASIEKRPPPPNKVTSENRNSTVVRIADYQVTINLFYSYFACYVLLSCVFVDEMFVIEMMEMAG